jgi:hypothetical protein
MTMQEIRAECRQLLFETGDAPGATAPLLWQRIITRSVDKLAKDHYLLFGLLSANLVAGQSRYCIPNVFRETGIYIKYPSATSDKTPVEDLQRRQMHKRNPGWENWASGTPLYAVCDAAGGPFDLSPAPAVAVTNGLFVEGYYAPGQVWERDANGAALTLTDSSVCPLPDFALSALIYEASYIRCIQFPTKENGARVAMLQAERMREIGELEVKAARFFPRNRGGNYGTN